MDESDEPQGPPAKVPCLPGRTTRSSFEETKKDMCLICQAQKRDRHDRRRWEEVVRIGGHSTPATLMHAAEVRGDSLHDERVLLQIRDQDVWAKDIRNHRSCYQTYTSPAA